MARVNIIHTDGRTANVEEFLLTHYQRRGWKLNEVAKFEPAPQPVEPEVKEPTAQEPVLPNEPEVKEAKTPIAEPVKKERKKREPKTK